MSGLCFLPSLLKVVKTFFYCGYIYWWDDGGNSSGDDGGNKAERRSTYR